jgi:hypothetical protein
MSGDQACKVKRKSIKRKQWSRNKQRIATPSNWMVKNMDWSKFMKWERNYAIKSWPVEDLNRNFGKIGGF